MRRALVFSAPVMLGAPALAASIAPEAIDGYERASGGHIGVYARNLLTGAEFGWRAHQRFVMCSTFKASLAALVLSRVDRGEDHLETLVHYTPTEVRDWYAPVAMANLAKGVLSVGELCRGAVEASDNTCANLLLARVGGPGALTAFWRAHGDTVSRLEDSEPLLNRTPLGGVRDTTTPAAMAGSLRTFVLGDVLSSTSRAQLKAWLVGCLTSANRLRAGLPKNWVIGDKTGNNGKDAAGDIAIAWTNEGVPIVICAYTRGGDPTAAQFDAVFAGVGRLVASRLA